MYKRLLPLVLRFRDSARTRTAPSCQVLVPVGPREWRLEEGRPGLLFDSCRRLLAQRTQGLAVAEKRALYQQQWVRMIRANAAVEEEDPEPAASTSKRPRDPSTDKKKKSSSTAYDHKNTGSNNEGAERSSSSSSDRPQDGEDAQKEAGSTGAGFGANFSETAKKGYEAAMGAASAGWERVRSTNVVEKVRDGINFVREELDGSKPRRRRRVSSATGSPDGERMETHGEPNTSVSAVVVHQKKRSPGWRGRLEEFLEEVQKHPIIDKVRSVKKHPVFVKGHEVAEEIRDRWETSDHPMVHRIQDINDSVFGETATAAAMKEIKRRDPGFLMDDFLLEVQQDIRPVLEAYRKGDVKVLRDKCRSEVIQRSHVEMRALEYRGATLTNKILHISDVELKETKLVGRDPVIVITFRTQQIFCVTDRSGKVLEGGKDDILTVYYAWAMEQSSLEDMGVDDSHPRWHLREMQQLAMQAIV